jgi:hypothetical protein
MTKGNKPKQPKKPTTKNKTSTRITKTKLPFEYKQLGAYPV